MNAGKNLRYKVLDLPPDLQYQKVFELAGRKVLVHSLVDKTSGEFSALLHCAEILLTRFKKIEILPSLFASEGLYRSKILPGVKQNKNPDYRIDEKYWELESPTAPYNYKKIDQRIRKGYQQANCIILFFEQTVNGFSVKKAVEDRMKINKDLSQVVVIVAQNLVSCIKRKPGK